MAAPRRGRNDEYARQIGHAGEVYAYRVFEQLLPGFDADCWVSSSRALLGLDGGDDTLGYDFRYVDVDGVLSSKPGPSASSR